MMIALRGSRTLGQIDTLATIISAGLQAGAATYGAYMQQSIAKMQARTQKEIQERQQAAADAQAKAQQTTAEQQAKTQQIQAAAAPTILGIDRDIFIVGGVAVGLMMGVVAIVVSKSSSKKAETVPA